MGGGQAWEPIYLPAVSWQAGVKLAFGMDKAAVEASWWQESLGQKPFQSIKSQDQCKPRSDAAVKTGATNFGETDAINVHYGQPSFVWVGT